MRFRRPAFAIVLALAGGASCWSTASLAQQVDSPASATTGPAATLPSSGATIRLTDRERDAILDANTVDSAAAARGELMGAGGVDRCVHGEIGAMVGSNGARGVYGTAAVPLGDSGEAMMSFEDSRFGRLPH